MQARERVKQIQSSEQEVGVGGAYLLSHDYSHSLLTQLTLQSIFSGPATTESTDFSCLPGAFSLADAPSSPYSELACCADGLNSSDDIHSSTSCSVVSQEAFLPVSERRINSESIVSLSDRATTTTSSDWNRRSPDMAVVSHRQERLIHSHFNSHEKTFVSPSHNDGLYEEIEKYSRSPISPVSTPRFSSIRFEYPSGDVQLSSAGVVGLWHGKVDPTYIRKETKLQHIETVLTGVDATTYGGAIEVQLIPRELFDSERHSALLPKKTPVEEPKFLVSPSQVDLQLSLASVFCPTIHRSEFFMTFGDAPSFVRGLHAEVIELGKPLQLECQVAGNPAPTVQWFKNGIELPADRFVWRQMEEMVFILYLEETAVEDGGMYTVRATNTAGQADSTVEIIINLAAPRFTRELSDVRVTLNQTVTLETSVHGVPLPQTSWMVSGVELLPSEKHQIEQINERSFLTIKNVTLHDTEMTYTCQASNQTGTASTSARLLPQVAPRCTGPELIMVKEGEQILIECEFTGIPRPSAVWLKDNKPIPEGQRFRTALDVNLATLCIEPATSQDQGWYTLILENDVGQDMFNVTVNVDPKPVKTPEVSEKPHGEAPEFIVKPEETTVKESSELTLKCQVVGHPKPEINWFVRGEPVISSDKYILEVREEVHMLIVKSVSVKDSGQYRVEASNQFGRIEETVTITVKPKREGPVFTEVFTDTKVEEKHNVTLSARVSGKPEPTVKWFYEGIEIKPTFKSKMTKKEDLVTLSLSNVTLKQSGIYKCLATNKGGHVEHSANLTVIEKMEAPKFTSDLPKREVCEGQKAVLSCTVQGKPLPEVSIKQDGNELNISRFKLEQKESKDQINITMTLKESRPDDSCLIEAIATNPAGQAVSSGKLQVQALRTESDVEEVEKPPDEEKKPVKIVPIEEKAVGTSPSKKKPVGKAPSFVEIYSDTEVTERTVLVLKVVVEGDPVPKVVWSRDSLELVETLKIKMSSKDNVHTLTITGISKKQSGIYFVEAANKYGKAEHKANVIVTDPTEPPKFVKKLLKKDFKDGQKAKIEVQVKGLPLPSLAWYRNGVLLEIKDRIKVDESSMKDTVTSVLCFEPCFSADEGNIKCIATNSVGQAESEARVTISVKREMPKFLKKPANVEVMEYDEMVMETEVSGQPEPEITWHRGEVKLEPSDRIRYESDAQTYRLIIKRILKDETGIITVKASNGVGTMSASGRLKVIPVKAPVIVTPFKDLKAPEQGPAKFSAKITAFPLPTIWWYYKGEPVDESENIQVSHDEKQELYTLTFLGNLKGMSGNVRVRAENKGGEDSCSADMEIHGRAPEFIEKPLKCTVLEGATAEFRCRVTGDPEPTVEWTKGKWTKKENDFKTRVFFDGTRHILQMDNIDKKEAGTYTVTITNIYGSDNCPATVIITDKPEEAQDWMSQLKKSETIKRIISQEEYDWLELLKKTPRNKWEQLAEEYGFDLRHMMKLYEEWEKVEKGEIEPWKILKPLEDQHVKENEYSLFECVVNNKKVPVEWFVNGKAVEVGPKYQIFAEGDKHRLAINKAKPTDEGEVMIKYKKLTSIAKLTVEPLIPEFRYKLQDVTVVEHTTATFMTKLNDEDLEVEWFLNGKKVEESDKFMIEHEERTHRLIVKDSLLTDAGPVKAVCRGVEEMANLIVTAFEPYFLKGAGNVTTREGSTAVFEVIVFPRDAKVKWFLDDLEIIENNKFELVEEGDVRRLRLYEVDRDDEGEISCRVGYSFTSANLYVEVCETEVVEHRLLFQNEESTYLRTLAEFSCIRNSGSGRLTLQSSSNADSPLYKTVEKPPMRRWVVDKCYLNNTSSVMVKKWNIESSVYYTCTKDDLWLIERGLAFIVNYGIQRVTFTMEMSLACYDVIWMYNGVILEPSSRRKINFSDDGLMHTMEIIDVTDRDQGIYTFQVCNQQRKVFIRKTEEVHSDARSRRKSRSSLPGGGAMRRTKSMERLHSSTMEYKGEFNQFSLMPFVEPFKFKHGINGARCKEREPFTLTLTTNKPNAPVKWYRNGKEVVPNDKYEIIVDGCEQKLICKSASIEDDDGEWEAQLPDDNSKGKVKVEEGPIIWIENVKEITVMEGETVTLEGKVNRAGGRITWYKDGKSLKRDKRLEVIVEDCWHRLIIHDCTLEDAAAFSAKVALETTKGKLTVTEAPLTFVEKLDDLTVMETKGGEMVCKISKPKGQVTWYRDGVEISSKDPRFVISSDKQGVHKLTLKDAEMTDAGEITAKVGDDETKAKLMVTELPVEMTPLKDVRCLEKEKVSFMTELNKKGVEVEWLKNGEPIDMSSGFETKVEGKKFYLLLSSATLDHQGDFSAVAKDKSTSAKLTVDESVLKLCLFATEQSLHIPCPA